LTININNRNKFQDQFIYSIKQTNMFRKLFIVLLVVLPALVSGQNANIVINTGGNVTITLPSSSVNKTGSYNLVNGLSGTLTFGWQQISGPNTATITDDNTLTPKISGLIQGEYMFQFNVIVTSSNGQNHWNQAYFTITVNPSPAHNPPTVNAGSDQSITLPDNTISLSGTVAAANGYMIDSKAWTKISGPSANINSAGELTTNVTITTSGNYVFRLTATDNTGLSAYDEVIVSVNTALPSGGAWASTSGASVHQYNTNNGAIILGAQNLPSAAENGTKLVVNGNLLAQKVTVIQGSWADFVFEKNYTLLPLKDLQQYINKYEHLPGVPSAKEVSGTALDVAKTQALLLQKIEELTLYVIAQDKKIEQQCKKLDAQQRQIKSLKRK
jgi:hypothetical protein